MNKEIFIPVGATFKLRGKEYRVTRGTRPDWINCRRNGCAFEAPYVPESRSDEIKKKICHRLACLSETRSDQQDVYFQEAQE